MSVCRVCLCSNPRKDIKQLDPTENGKKQSYEHVMLFCLGIQIEQDSNISTKLCVKCYRKIVVFYEFKSLALRNDAQLKSFDSLTLQLKSEIFLKDDDIKIEKITYGSDFENQDEPLIQVKEDEGNAESLILEVKDEYKEEDQSDDEFLSVIKTIKNQAAEETKENAPVIKKRGRPKKPITKQKEEKKTKVCDACGKEVKNLRAHLLKHIPIELRKQIKCELCDTVFTSFHARRKHIKRKHLAIKKQCHLCERSVLNIRQHILTIHETESLPYQCVPCGRKFLTQSRLDAHVTVHTKDRPYECDICGNKFRVKLSLTNHKRQVHDKEKTHLCQFCSKSFFKKHHLHVHLRSHTKEKPYTCPDCGKHLQSSTTLRNHRLTHTEEKNFKCSMCDMSFATNNYLRAHLVSHTKVKRYPCQYCDVRFHRSDHRKRHEFTAHLRHHSGNT